MSRFSNPRGKTGTKSKSTSAKRDKKPVETPHGTEKSEPVSQEEWCQDGPASVSIGMSFGFSTEYAAEQGRVHAQCTLPCEADDDSIEATGQRARQIALNEAQLAMDDLIDAVFPELKGRS